MYKIKDAQIFYKRVVLEMKVITYYLFFLSSNINHKYL